MKFGLCRFVTTFVFRCLAVVFYLCERFKRPKHIRSDKDNNLDYDHHYAVEMES